MSDDWQVVEEALADFAPRETHGTLALTALARLREREAQNARKVEAYDNARATVKIEGNTRAYYVLRAEAAEARVAELGAELAQWTQSIATEALVARVARLEEALREIAEGLTIGPTGEAYHKADHRARQIARRALAHEEEK